MCNYRSEKMEESQVARDKKEGPIEKALHGTDKGDQKVKDKVTAEKELALAQ